MTSADDFQTKLANLPVTKRADMLRHEMNNTIAAIRGFAETVHDLYDELDGEAFQRLMMQMIASADNLHALVELVDNATFDISE